MAEQPTPPMTPALDPSEPPRRGLYYALRTGVAAAIATGIWQSWEINHGWWIAIAAVVVIQPHRADTRLKSLNRVVGTLIGTVTATLAALFLPLNFATAGIVVAVTVLLGWRLPNLREPLPMAAITAVLVFTLDKESQSLEVGFLRSVEIVIGVLIALVLAAIPLPGEDHSGSH